MDIKFELVAKPNIEEFKKVYFINFFLNVHQIETG